MKRELARLVVMGAFLGVELLRAVDRKLAKHKWTKADEEFKLWQQRCVNRCPCR